MCKSIVAPPSDPEVKKVADKLASFFAKNGRQFENVARRKKSGDTKSRFLFDVESPEYNYYEDRVAQEEQMLPKQDPRSPQGGAVKLNNLGVGAGQSGEVTPEDDMDERYEKRMMLGYRFRPHPLNYSCVWNCVTMIFLLVGVGSRLGHASEAKLRFKDDGTFKILQIADMHYGNGRTTDCSDVSPVEYHFCSDLNTTAFIRRLIQQEAPDLIVFTGDNIGWSATDAKLSMDMAFAPAVESKIPWAAVLGNHDVESTLSRRKLMEYIVQMEGSVAKVQDPLAEGTYGWGNYYLQVFGLTGSKQENFSLLNLYFLDSGDNSKLKGVEGYDWIRLSQISWFSKLSQRLKAEAKGVEVPALAYFHIPLPEYDTVLYRDHIVGVQQEDVYSPPMNSGFFATLREEKDVKATFVGHDHVNDYCGTLMGINLCYGGGTGYHAYGKVGWSRRARIVVASLDQQFSGPPNISTWKRLDDPKFGKEDAQLLYSKPQDALSTSRTFSYRNGCCFPWSAFKYRQGSCYFWNALIYTGAFVLLTGLSFLSGFFIDRCRSKNYRAAYRLVKAETKAQD